MIRNGKPVVTLRYSTIKNICIGILILNVSIIIYSIDILISAINIKLEVGNFINMISDNEGNVLPSLLALPGLLCFALNVISIYFLYELFSPDEKPTLNSMTYAYIMSCFGSVCTMLIICVTVLTHSYSTHQKLHDGIKEAMGNYSSNSLIKSQIDLLQIQFQCCGSKKYDEWYDIAWYDENFVKTHSNKSSENDSTPFSCCSMKSIYPCIHHGITSKSLPYHYSPESNMSISIQGCFTAIKVMKISLGWQIIGSIFTAIVLQVTMLSGMRFIQTAHFEHSRFLGDSVTYTAWLIGCYVGRPEKNPPPIPPVPTELMD